MQRIREIVTKAVIGKGKKVFTDTEKITPYNKPTTIIGCWEINHQFKGSEHNNQIVIDGSYDINIWYSYDNDTKTDVIKNTNTYHEVVNMQNDEEVENSEIIIRSLKQPNCTNVEIENGTINYTVEKELGVELVGDVFVKIADNSEDLEDDWNEILDQNPEKIEEEIEEGVQEEFIDDQEIV